MIRVLDFNGCDAGKQAEGYFAGASPSRIDLISHLVLARCHQATVKSRPSLLHYHIHQPLRHDDHLDDFVAVDEALHFAVSEDQRAQIGFRDVRRHNDF